MFGRLQFVSAILLLLLIPRGGDAYSGGAPSSACQEMFPTGHNVAAQTTLSPVTFNTSSGLYFKAGDYIPVTLRSTDANSFKGLFIQARLQSDNTKIIGSFDSASLPAGLKTIQCGGIQDGAVTHSSSADKSSVTVYWHAMNVTVDVIFQATIVREKTVFWTPVRTPTLTYSTTRSNFSSGEPESSAAPRIHAPVLAYFVTVFLVFFY